MKGLCIQSEQIEWSTLKSHMWDRIRDMLGRATFFSQAARPVPSPAKRRPDVAGFREGDGALQLNPSAPRNRRTKRHPRHPREGPQTHGRDRRGRLQGLGVRTPKDAQGVDSGFLKKSVFADKPPTKPQVRAVAFLYSGKIVPKSPNWWASHRSINDLRGFEFS